MNEVQKELLVIMKDIEKVIYKTNLRYSLSSGTVLGKVRHNGFIPWDDDIDYEVHVDDFEKLMKLLEQKLPAKYKVVWPGNNIKASNFFGKVYNTEVEVESGEYDNKKFGEYLWIDIFAITNTNRKSISLLKWMIFFRWARQFRTRWPIVNIIKAPFLKLIPLKLITKSINKKIVKYRDDDGASNFSPWVAAPPFKVWNYNVKFELINTDFYGIKTKMFKDTDGYLTSKYTKNYMTPPPEKDRLDHGIKIKKQG